MVQPYFELGPITIYYYGLSVASAILIYYIYLKKKAKSFGFKSSQVESALFFTLIFALIGARLYHTLSSLSYYLIRPHEIFYFWQGGLGIFGAIAGGALGIFIFCRFHEIELFRLLNLFAPPLLLAQAVGRIGNFFNREGFGPPTNLPLKIFIPASRRPLAFVESDYFHPTFFYESLLCLIAFLFYIYLKKLHHKKNHFGLAYYLASYGLIRFITEFFRIDTLKISNFQAGFFISLAMFVSGIFLLSKKTAE